MAKLRPSSLVPTSSTPEMAITPARAAVMAPPRPTRAEGSRRRSGDGQAVQVYFPQGNPLGRQGLQQPEPGIALGKRREGEHPYPQLRAQLLHLPQKVVLEGGDDDIVRHAVGFYTFYHPLHKGDGAVGGGFQLHIHHPHGLDHLQGFVQRGDGVPGKFGAFADAEVHLPQLVQRQLHHPAGLKGGQVHMVIVQDDKPAIGGDLDVGLDAVGTQLHGLAEGGQGILRGMEGRPPMGNDIGHGGLPLLGFVVSV